MSNLAESRRKRIDIRTSSKVKKLLQQAAAANHTIISKFLLKYGLIPPEEALTNRRFVLDDEQRDAFHPDLDSPPKKKLRLTRFLTEPNVFE